MTDRFERRGDALTSYVEKIDGDVRVDAHDDGGVTLTRRNRRGENVDRVAFMREEWDAIVRRVQNARDQRVA